MFITQSSNIYLVHGIISIIRRVFHKLRINMLTSPVREIRVKIQIHEDNINTE